MISTILLQFINIIYLNNVACYLLFQYDGGGGGSAGLGSTNGSNGRTGRDPAAEFSPLHAAAVNGDKNSLAKLLLCESYLSFTYHYFILLSSFVCSYNLFIHI